MIMKKLNIILSAAIAVLAVSCEKSSTIAKPEEQAEKYTRTFTCVFAAPESVDPDTKVSIASDGKVAWEVGDKIMIHGGDNGASRKLVTLTAGDISADGKHATFTIEDLAPYDRTSSGVVSQYYAQYPASAVPSGSMYYECAFNNTNAMLMAACNEGDTFRFFNLCGVISYVVSGDFDSVVFSGNNSEEVTFTDYYQVRVRDDGAGAACNYFKPGNGFKTNTPGTSISTSVVSDGAAVNYIYLPRGVNFTGGFTFKFIKGGEIVKTVSTSSSVNVAHGKLLPLGDITSHLKTYVAPSNHDASHPAIAGAEDLGSVETANCYIIDGSNAANAEKVFKFKAVRGNGTTPAGVISSVEILWETWNNAETVTANSVVAEADFDKQDGDDDYWITFKMPATLHAGNALIAALNAGGTVLWSWHIWVPSTAITSSTYGGISTAPMMDRNLGALVIAEGDADTDAVVESCGMFYQWGRKDPFPGPNSLSLAGNYDATSAIISGTIETREATSSAEINKYPNYFGVTGADSDGYKDWSTDHSSTLWGSAKNENDPCPPGWKLPIFASGTGDLWDKDVTTKTSLTGYELNITHHWLKLGKDYDALNPTTTGYVYFPLAGYRTQDNGGYAYAGKRALIWQAYGESGDYAKCLYSDGSFVGYRTERKGRGGNVRCVAIPEP